MNSLHEENDGVWKALAHPTRRQLLDQLFVAPCTTGDLVAALEMDRHVVMAHLTVLREADLVLTQKQGRHRLNFLNAVPLEQIHQRWVSPASGPWAAALLAVRDRSTDTTRRELTDTRPTTQRKTSHG